MKKLLLLTFLALGVFASPAAADDIVDTYTDLPAPDGCKGGTEYSENGACWWHGVEEQKTTMIYNAHTGEEIVNTDKNKMKRNYFYEDEHVIVCHNYAPYANDGDYDGDDGDTDGEIGTKNFRAYAYEPYGNVKGSETDIPFAWYDETLVCFQSKYGMSASTNPIIAHKDTRDPVEGQGGYKHDYNFIIQTYYYNDGDINLCGEWCIEDFYIHPHDDPDSDGVSPSTRNGGDECPNEYGTLSNGCPQTDTINKEFVTPGLHTYTVPEKTSGITVELEGAGGGEKTGGEAVGGKGGYAEGTLQVEPGDTLYINVGGQGTDTSGGSNGGGDPSTNEDASYGGGGKSDVRLNGNDNDDIVILAAGGGGALANDADDTYGAIDGADGGGLQGESAASSHGGDGGRQPDPSKDRYNGCNTDNDNYLNKPFVAVNLPNYNPYHISGGGAGRCSGEHGNAGGGGSSWYNASVVSGFNTVTGGGSDTNGKVVLKNVFYLTTNSTDWSKGEPIDVRTSFDEETYNTVSSVSAEVIERDTTESTVSLEAKGDGIYAKEDLFTPDQEDTEYTLRVTAQLDSGETFTQTQSQVVSVQDDDGDDVRNYLDECAQTYGNMPNGCPDDDGDKVQNSQDECRGTFGRKDNGCPNNAPEIDQIYYPENVSVDTEFSLTVSASDEDGHSLYHAWDFPDENKRGEDVVHSFSSTGNKTLELAVGDGYNTTTREFYVNVTGSGDTEGADIETSINLTSPGSNISSTPVEYSFSANANNGTLKILRTQSDTSTEVVEVFDHTDGNKTYTFTENDTPLGVNKWSIYYQRESDGSTTKTGWMEFNLTGITDSDGDGVRDSLDDCVNTAGSEATNGCPDDDGDGVKNSEDVCGTTYGLKQNGCENSDPVIDSLSVEDQPAPETDFSVSASVSDSDTEQDLDVYWESRGMYLGEGTDTSISLPYADNWTVEAKVSDGIINTSKTKNVEVVTPDDTEEEEQDSGETDIPTELVLRNPEQGADIPDNPVTYRFNLTANFGDVSVLRKKSGDDKFEEVKSYTHERGREVYRFNEDGIDEGQYRYVISYVREADNQGTVSEIRDFELLGLPDDDNDNVPNSEDECSGTSDNPTWGVKENGCANTPPNIDSVTVPSSVEQGTKFNISASASDQDIEHEDRLEYEWSNGKIGQKVEACFDTYGYQNVEITVSDGVTSVSEDRVVQVNKTDKTCTDPEDNFQTDVNYPDETQPAPETNISTAIYLKQPQEEEHLTTRNIGFNFNVTANIGKVAVVMDGKEVKSQSHGRGSESHDLYVSDFEPGSHNYYVRYVRTADQKTFRSEEKTFYIDSIPDKRDFNTTVSGGENDSQDFDEGEDIEFDSEINDTFDGNVSLVRNGTIVDSENVSGSNNTFNFTDSPDVGDEDTQFCYELVYTSPGGETSSSGCENITISPVFNDIELQREGDKVVEDPNQEVSYKFNITSPDGNITLEENGEEIFSTQKNVSGEKSYTVNSTVDSFGDYYVDVFLEREGETFSQSTNYRVVNKSEVEELCGDGIDNDYDGEIDENPPCDETSETDEGEEEEEENELVRNITIQPKEWSVDNGNNKTREFTIDSTLEEDVQLQLSVPGSCESFYFRGINEYSRQVMYNVPAESENDVPVKVYMPLGEVENSCEVQASYNNTQEEFNFTVNNRAGAEQILDFVSGDISPLTGSFAESFAFERCKKVNGSVQNKCEEPVTTEINPAAIMGLMILLFIGIGAGRSYYESAYKGGA